MPQGRPRADARTRKLGAKEERASRPRSAVGHSSGSYAPTDAALRDDPAHPPSLDHRPGAGDQAERAWAIRRDHQSVQHPTWTARALNAAHNGPPARSQALRAELLGGTARCAPTVRASRSAGGSARFHECWITGLLVTPAPHGTRGGVRGLRELNAGACSRTEGSSPKNCGGSSVGWGARP